MRLQAVLRVFVISLSLLAMVLGCTDARRDLKPVPTTDTQGLEPSVVQALARARADLERVESSKPSNKALAEAYGELAMTYHAQSIVPPAEVAYSDARLLAPDDWRWPYLLGHLYNDSSRVPEALGAFEAASKLDPDNVAILFSLGEAYLQHGDFDQAQSTYEKLKTNGSARAAALTGLGKVALAKHHYQDAVNDFEEVLKLWPAATRLRQPLAMAYQGLGDHAKAEASLREYSVDGFEPEIADPMADALGAKVAASRALLRRGQRFGRSMRFDLAEPAFRAAVEADPTNAEAVANLGVTLANLGKLDEAQQALNQSLKLDDHNALAHLSLGVVLDRQGNDQGAIAQYKAASDADPGNVDALVYLADAQMRLGHADEAIKSYEQALARVGGSERIELSIALANVKAGHYPQARKVLESASKAYPNNPELTNALARLLATAPLSSVRDGERALGLAKPLFESSHNPIVGETYAMALAETGNYNQAELLQKETIIVFEHTGGKYRKPFLERNLALYQQHRATREGWAADDPVFEPRSPAAQLARANEGSDTQTSAH